MSVRERLNLLRIGQSMPIEEEHPLNGPHPTDARI